MPRPLPASLPQAHVENLEEQVKEQEVYHGELQEVERWLLQMSSRMVTPDPSVGGGLDEATQQLARHKVSRPLAQLAALPSPSPFDRCARYVSFGSGGGDSCCRCSRVF